ncbi:MAG: class I SAM-dependent methyltransferase [Gammaproteobacteria bacterium]|nr:class I SAM-dependent methyltransferase [Gammaproteobacteria bacterium]
MKSLPKRPELEFLKKEARVLRVLQMKGDPACCDRIRDYDTSCEAMSDADILAGKFSINDAQRVIAHEYGYASWAALKKYIELINLPLYHMVTDRQGYHRTITDSYDARSKNYENSEWHREVALTTVKYWPPEPGQHVLDIATGTGTIAFHCAELVGPQGKVVGVDISTGMLDKCREKLAERKLANLAFTHADGEQLDFQPNSFDRIYCANAIFWMSNLQAALRHWYELLKPGGVVGFNATPSSSFFWGCAARKALAMVGIDFICNIPAGDEANAREMLECAGFTNFRLHAAPNGRYIATEDAKDPLFLTLQAYAPGQYPHPLEDVSDETMQLAQQAYNAEVDKHATEDGVWHDMTQYYVYGQKPADRE